MKTAVLIDGAFYRFRSREMLGEKGPQERAEELNSYCRRHLKERNRDYHELYRIFYYDCEPLNKKVYHPFLRRMTDFSKSELNLWMADFLKALKSTRKFALRMGKLDDIHAGYILKEQSLNKMCSGEIKYKDLRSSDFIVNVGQKGVDMKIGLDIASLAFKKQVDQVVLISGDSDFVSAAKLARREGIDFILDPLGAPVKEDLLEHIDGLRTCDSRFYSEQFHPKIDC